MGFDAIGAILDAVFRIGKTSAATVAQRIQRAIAKQTAEIFLAHALVAGKILTFAILNKFIVFHALHLTQRTTEKHPVVHGQIPFSLRFLDG